MSIGFYKNRLYTTDISSALKKIIIIRSPSIWFRTPKPIRIRQSGRTGNRGVTPSIDLCDVVVALVESEPSWMDPIWDYIIDGSLPDDRKEAAKIRARSARFTNNKGSLYKRGFFTPILKCIA